MHYDRRFCFPHRRMLSNVYAAPSKCRIATESKFRRVATLRRGWSHTGHCRSNYRYWRDMVSLQQAISVPLVHLKRDCAGAVGVALRVVETETETDSSRRPLPGRFVGNLLGEGTGRERDRARPSETGRDGSYEPLAECSVRVDPGRVVGGEETEAATGAGAGAGGGASVGTGTGTVREGRVQVRVQGQRRGRGRG